MDFAPSGISYASGRRPDGGYDRWLFRAAAAWVCATVVLLVAGALVTSKGAGLAVPDWPTTYGENMFLYHPSKWVGNIKYEHVHRLIASGIGLMTIGMVVLLAQREPRRWVRRLGYVALGAVIFQGILGGLTVMFLLPPAISSAHAGLAQLFFCSTVTVALAQTRMWRSAGVNLSREGGASLRRWCIAATAMIFVQLMLGAVMRHTESGTAIRDLPLAYGRIFPALDAATIASINVDRRLGEPMLPEISAGQILIHYAHRMNAMLTATIIVIAAVKVIRSRAGRWAARPAWLALGLLPVQITLGAWTVLSLLDYLVNTAHVVVGATLLATSLVLTLRVFRSSLNRESIPDSDSFQSRDREGAVRATSAHNEPLPYGRGSVISGRGSEKQGRSSEIHADNPLEGAAS